MADRRARLRRNYAWEAKCLVRALVEDGIPLSLYRRASARARQMVGVVAQRRLGEP